MSGKSQAECKKYMGKIYEFVKIETSGKHGGNGGVYKVKITNKDVKFPVVAKFFEYNKDREKKIKRYIRFKNEVSVIRELNDIRGIMKILDSNCPENVPLQIDEAWYLMPKATVYSICNNHILIKKLKDMLELANIILELHNRGKAHRDIKPENILVLDNHICLADFGLVWAIDEERVTDEDERIGPYKILPPELEHIDMGLDIDFRVSDVYLFAKVIWMVLKEDNSGFKGQYNRKDIQVYLNATEYHVDTLEPIHCLLEQATCDSIEKRINIQKCISYLQEELDIVQCKMPKKIVSNMCFNEKTSEFINNNSPQKFVYEDIDTIYKYIEKVVNVAQVFIIIEDSTKEEIEVSDITRISKDLARFNLFIDGKKIREYLFRITSMTCSMESEEKDIIIELGDVEKYDASYGMYGDIKNGFAFANTKYIFNHSHKIQIQMK